MFHPVNMAEPTQVSLNEDISHWRQVGTSYDFFTCDLSYHLMFMMSLKYLIMYACNFLTCALYIRPFFNIQTTGEISTAGPKPSQ